MATTSPKLTIPFVVGTDKIVGQGNFPELVARISYSDASDSSPVWTDVTDKVRSFSISRGRESELDEVDAGTCTLVLDNRDRDFDPTVSSIRPMSRVWLLEQFTGETQSLFYGFIETVDQQWPAPGMSDATAVVNCVDEFKVLARKKLPTTSPPRDTYAGVVESDQPNGYWRMDDTTQQVVGTVGPTLVPTNGNLLSSVGSAIVGDNGGYQQVDGDPYLFANVQAGETGDVAGLGEFTCELWFQFDSFPGGAQLIWRGPTQGIGDGTYQLQILTTGALELAAKPASSAAVTISSSALVASTWYHVVGTITGGNLRLYINGAQVASSAWSGVFGVLDEGTNFTIGHTSSGITQRIDEAAFYRYGLSSTRISAHYTAGTARGFPRAQLPGARINAVLDAVTSHAPRSIQPGTNQMIGSYMRGQSPLDELRQAVKAESVDAVLFIAKDGTLTFLADGYRLAPPYNTPAATFGDAGGSELPYEEVDVDYSDSFLANEWRVSEVGGFTHTASDSTSIDAYDERTATITDVPTLQSADAAAIATALLAKTKDPQLRVLSLAVNTAVPDVAEAVLGLEIGDRIEVRRTPPGGGARITEELFVQHIHIDGSNESPVWRVVFGVSPL